MIELLLWDSEFFGFRIARTEAESLTLSTAAEARRWCAENSVSCLYFLAQAVSVNPPEGFRLVDERVTYRWEARPVSAPTAAVRPFEPDDLEALEAIARASHRDSRFYQDPAFDRARCDDLYVTWIRRSCKGWADTVLVAIHGGQPAGYITCTGNAIGLIAVAESAQGRGLGVQLVTAAQRYFHRAGCGHVEVVTQGRNHAAHRLYQRCGFHRAASRNWYHLHV